MLTEILSWKLAILQLWVLNQIPSEMSSIYSSIHTQVTVYRDKVYISSNTTFPNLSKRFYAQLKFLHNTLELIGPYSY